MKKIIFLFLFFNFSLTAYNQFIKGSVLDELTHNKISFALIYFNGTFTATSTDSDWKFEINISDYPAMPLTISASGYYSVDISIATYIKPVIIYMKPKVFEVNETVYNTNALKERKENMKLFKNTFLGTSWNARQCEITNENDIKFISKPDNDTLKAYSLKPINIVNRALGYQVNYFLDEFELFKYSGTFLITGNISFDEDLNSDETKKEFFEIRRKRAYTGSRMHFFRSLWENDSLSVGFLIKNSEDEFLNYSQITFQKDSTIKFLKYPGKKTINQSTDSSAFYTVFSAADVYYDKDGNFSPIGVSIVTLEKDIYFDKNGYFDSSGIFWEGKMARQRIADWLPYEYSYK
jgi:hypothetical protein